MRIQRQAVVVVHGIGEQKPLNTIRTFVGSGRPRPEATGPAGAEGIVGLDADVYFEPSPAAQRVSDRMVTAQWNPTSSAGRMPNDAAAPVRTDFFEFYWAPHYRDNTIGQVVGWAVSLLRRRRKHYSHPRMVGPIGNRASTTRGLLLAAMVVAAAIAAGVNFWPHLVGSVWPLATWLIAAWVLVVAAAVTSSFLGLLSWVRVLAAAVAVSVALLPPTLGHFAWFGILLSLLGTTWFGAVLVVVFRWLALILGDASRYLSNGPGEVEEKDAIRSELISLLRKLPDLKELDGSYRYERIVLVGHSLGAVIAYDALTLLWGQAASAMRLSPPSAQASIAQELVSAAETDAEHLDWFAPRAYDTAGRRNALIRAGDDAPMWTRESYRKQQRRISSMLAAPSTRLDRLPGPPERRATQWGYDAKTPTRWLISDFVTAGSPLTYADAFFVTRAAELEHAFVDRTLSSCPPDRQPDVATRFRYLVTSDRVPVWSNFHQGAVFGTVRWTNFYFNNDLVGGPVADIFGVGVHDVSLGGSTWLPAVLRQFPHSAYWSPSPGSRNREGNHACRAALREIIGRDCRTLLLTEPGAFDEVRLGQIGYGLGSAHTTNKRTGTSDAELFEVRLRTRVDGIYQPAFLPALTGHRLLLTGADLGDLQARFHGLVIEIVGAQDAAQTQLAASDEDSVRPRPVPVPPELGQVGEFLMAGQPGMQPGPGPTPAPWLVASGLSGELSEPGREGLPEETQDVPPDTPQDVGELESTSHPFHAPPPGGD